MSAIPPVAKKVRDLDAAADAVRGLVAGKLKLAAVASHLDGLEPDELEFVSLATRVPVSRLQSLRKLAGAQMSLLK